MTKKEIIEVINNAFSVINTKIFDEKEKNKIGNNQFRELAALCRHAECFEEIKMLIQYNEAKALDEKKNDKESKNGIEGNSWAALMKNEKTFAKIVLECMESIQKASGDDEAQCLKDLSLFFGYFYWKARILAAEYSQKNASKSSEGQ